LAKEKSENVHPHPLYRTRAEGGKTGAGWQALRPTANTPRLPVPQ